MENTQGVSVSRQHEIRNELAVLVAEYFGISVHKAIPLVDSFLSLVLLAKNGG